jgi:hypothetical protein
MCAVHCLFAPAAVSLLPFVALTAEQPVVEWGLLLLSLGTSATVLVRGCVRQHRRWQALLPFGPGAAVLLWSRILEEAHPAAAATAVVAGALGVMASHALNIHWCRRAGAANCARMVSAPVSPPISIERRADPR